MKKVVNKNDIRVDSQKNDIEVDNEKNIKKEEDITKKSNQEKDDTINNKMKEKVSNKKKKIIFIVFIVLVFICCLIGCYFYFFKANSVKNIIIENKEFHEIEISWDSQKNASNYVVLISSVEFTSKDVNADLSDGKFNGNYQVIDINDNKLKYDNVLSNTSYYVAVVAYKNIGNNRKYSKSSKVVKFDTNALEINKITDLTITNSTDTSIDLKWSLNNFLVKNLDGTDIDVYYTLYTKSNENDEFVELAKDIKEENYSISSLTPFTRYSYKVVVTAMVDGKPVNSDDSNILEVTTKPMVVSGISSKSEGTSSISITWDKYNTESFNNAEASITYSIYASDSIDSEYNLIGENITDTSYIENDLEENKTRYYYVVVNIVIDDEKYSSDNSEIVSSTTDRRPISYDYGYTNPNPSGNTGSVAPSNPSSSGELTAYEKNEQARVIARQIANSITGSSDIEKVSKAAQAVSQYYYRGVHKETGNDYYTAYGVFIKGESSCAGTTRALGMVLEEMGYSWSHANENQWTHQWVIVTMDGQIGFADGQVGLVGYGTHPLG